MLTKYEALAITWLRSCFSYIEEVPIVWDSRLKRLSTNSQVCKWIKWWLGNYIVFLLWCSCVYTLLTQFYWPRKDLKPLQICILATGFCCFTATLAFAQGVAALRSNTYVSTVNNFIQLELNIYKSKYYSF